MAPDGDRGPCRAGAAVLDPGECGGRLACRVLVAEADRHAGAGDGDQLEAPRAVHEPALSARASAAGRPLRARSSFWARSSRCFPGLRRAGTARRRSTSGRPTPGQRAPTRTGRWASTRAFAGVEREVDGGSCHFEGEHTSIAFQGYLNGAVETRRACGGRHPRGADAAGLAPVASGPWRRRRRGFARAPVPVGGTAKCYGRSSVP